VVGLGILLLLGLIGGGVVLLPKVDPTIAALLPGGRGAPTATTAGAAPTATVAPLPTNTTPTQPAPTATSAPVVRFHVTPTSFQQTCTSPLDPLPALALSLDNGGSNVAVGYQVVTNGTSPNGHEPWAAANPASGIVAAGKQAQLTLTPASDICNQLWTAGATAQVSFTAGIRLTSGGAGATTVTESVSPYKLT
jgi:hypothetical protein